MRGEPADWKKAAAIVMLRLIARDVPEDRPDLWSEADGLRDVAEWIDRTRGPKLRGTELDLPPMCEPQLTTDPMTAVSVLRAEGWTCHPPPDPNAPCRVCGKDAGYSGPCQYAGCPLGADL